MTTTTNFDREWRKRVNMIHDLREEIIKLEREKMDEVGKTFHKKISDKNDKIRVVLEHKPTQ